MTGPESDGPREASPHYPVQHDSPEGGPGPRRILFFILLGVAGVLAAFSGKAFHVDDPVYVWIARQIHTSPLDFYGFSLNWHLSPEPVYEWNRNPPLVSYFIALAALIVGWGERALHLVFVIPALALVAGTWRLARLFRASPPVATLVLAFTPVFLVSATSLMADTTMAALYVWAVILWLEGAERRDWKRRAASGALLALACLAKYTAITALPLLAVFTLLRRNGRFVSLAYLAVPLLALALYHLYTLNLYGKGLLFEAAVFSAGQSAPGPRASYLTNALISLAFLGGGVLPALSTAPLTGRRALIVVAVAWLGAAALLLAIGRLDTTRVVVDGDVRWLYVIQAALFISAGVHVLILGTEDLFFRRDAYAATLLLWVLGIFVFMTFFNWTINARTLLPAIPAIAVLAGRAWQEGAHAGKKMRTASAIVLAVSGLVAISVAWGDYRHAAAARDAAREIHERTADTDVNVVFQGHWGFQYYMEQAGARAFDAVETAFRPGDVIVVPSNNPSTTDLPEIARPFLTLDVPAARWISLMNREARVGFYSHYWGPLPYVFGLAPPERFTLYEIQTP